MSDRVNPEPLTESGGYVVDLPSLLRTAEVEDLAGLAARLNDTVEPPYGVDIEVRNAKGFGTEGIEIKVSARGTVHEYPFRFEELEVNCRDLILEYMTPTMYSELESDIRVVEGLRVNIWMDDELDEWVLPPSVNRRTLESTGFVIQEPGRYTFRRPLSGRRTFDEWVQARFATQHQGLSVEAVDEGLTLADLRAASRTGPIPGGPRGARS